ncbi:MAG: nitrilase-related carbon-nitrogen hydrolase, partial [Candidatus Zixiibacteriota bacterium]
MKVGYVQCAPVLGDVQVNIDNVKRLLSQAESANLIVLPELCNCGYNFESRQQARDLSESIDDSVFVQFLGDICREKTQYIVAGLNERDGDRLYNTAVVVGPQGYIGKYRKLHLFMNEKDIFTPGDVGLPVFEIGECKIGVLICFDWIFPEVWRIPALKGADIICHPSNLVIPGLAQRAVPIHALMNRVYVITTNRYGTEGDLTFTGLSLIADPTGNVLAESPAVGDDVRIVDIDVQLAR